MDLFSKPFIDDMAQIIVADLKSFSNDYIAMIDYRGLIRDYQISLHWFARNDISYFVRVTDQSTIWNLTLTDLSITTPTWKHHRIDMADPKAFDQLHQLISEHGAKILEYGRMPIGHVINFNCNGEPNIPGIDYGGKLSVASRNQDCIVIKVGGHNKWGGRGQRRVYVSPRFLVFKIVSIDGSQLKVEPMIMWDAGRGNK